MGRGKSPKSLALIEAAARILEEIQPSSVRSVCYRLFTEGRAASMAKNETNKVGVQLTWAREQGRIPWAWIVDETRAPERVASWEHPEAFIGAVERSYRRDRWAPQGQRVEVWSEKGTVRGTLAPVLDAYGVTFRVLHGYASATAVYQAVQEAAAGAMPLTALYVGDWDPSGLHMSEGDLPGRLVRYHGPTACPIDLERIALTFDDIAEPTLPSFPLESKAKDVRFAWYTGRMAALVRELPRLRGRCWELDALSPVALRERVEAAILERIDPAAWERCGRAEAAEHDSLVSVLGAWRSTISGQASE